MACWSCLAPPSVAMTMPNGRFRAIRHAVALDATDAPNRQAGLPEVDMGIGIHTGEVVVGHIGSGSAPSMASSAAR